MIKKWLATEPYYLSELEAASEHSLAVCWFEWTAQPLTNSPVVLWASSSVDTIFRCQWLTAVSVITEKCLLIIVSHLDLSPRMWVSISDLVPTKFQRDCLLQAVLLLFASVILCYLSFHTRAAAQCHWHDTCDIVMCDIVQPVKNLYTGTWILHRKRQNWDKVFWSVVILLSKFGNLFKRNCLTLS